MNAYDKGFHEGVAGNRKNRSRVYQTNKAEDSFWFGYLTGMIQANPGKRIVECDRDGKIFATDNVDDCTCPTCGRRYIDGEADRKLIILL